MRCPHCGSVVEPLRDQAGALLCPVCQNSGRVAPPAWPSPPPSPPPQATEPAPAWQPPAQLSPPAWQAPPAKESGKPVAALVLGIASIVLFPIGLILGPIAIVYAVKAKNEIRRMPPGAPGEGMATTGLVLGIIGIVVGLFGGVIVMSAVVFVLVSNLGEGSESAPNISFNKDSFDMTLTVVQTDEAAWGDFSISPSGACTAGGFGNDAVQAGDVIDCSGADRPLMVTITHTPTNSLVYSTTFS